MIYSEDLITSNHSIKQLPMDLNPWDINSYTGNGIYYSIKAGWYFFIFGNKLNGCPAEIFEGLFNQNKLVKVENECAINEDLYLKTIAMLTGKVQDYKIL